MPGRLAFVVPGALRSVTGGNLYDRVVIEELRRRGWTVDVAEPGSVPAACDVVVVDSLALARIPQPVVPTVALLHQLPSDAEGKPHQREIERSALGRAHLVVTVSEHLARNARELTAAPVVVNRPGWDRAPADHRDPAPDIVLCVANAHPGKGVPEAVQAFVRAELDLELVVVGDPERDRDEGRRLREAMERTPRPVRLAGVVPAPELAALFARARAFLTASEYEGWPIAVSEAMASGVPVIGFDVPGLAELVRSGVDGVLVPVRDVASLARALARVAGDAALSRRLGASGRRRARTWATWDECARGFASLMETLARDLRPSGAQATGAR